MSRHWIMDAQNRPTPDSQTTWVPLCDELDSLCEPRCETQPPSEDSWRSSRCVTQPPSEDSWRSPRCVTQPPSEDSWRSPRCVTQPPNEDSWRSPRCVTQPPLIDTESWCSQRCVTQPSCDDLDSWRSRRSQNCVTQPPRDDLGSDGFYDSDRTLDETSSESSGVSHIIPVRRKPLGRAKALKILSNQPNHTGPIYKPVGIGSGGLNSPAAIPGQCQIQDTWKMLSCAPVAYQMQKMMENNMVDHEDCVESVDHCSQEAQDPAAVLRKDCVGKESSESFPNITFKQTKFKRLKMAFTRHDPITGSIHLVIPKEEHKKKILTNISQRKNNIFDFRPDVEGPDITSTSEFPTLGKKNVV